MSENSDCDRLLSPEVAEERERRASEFAAYTAKMEVIRALEAEALPLNRAAIFEALDALGIVKVVVEFNGSDDSGQIDGMDAFGTDDTVIELQGRELTMRAVDCADPWTPKAKLMGGEPSIIAKVTTIHDAIDTMAYDLLRSVQDGWENHDGAFGEFTFDVATRSITLDFNERHTPTEFYTYEL